MIPGKCFESSTANEGLGIAQQVITNKISGPPKVRTLRPAAEGKAKPKKTAKGNGATGRE